MFVHLIKRVHIDHWYRLNTWTNCNLLVENSKTLFLLQIHQNQCLMKIKNVFEINIKHYIKFNNKWLKKLKISSYKKVLEKGKCIK